MKKMLSVFLICLLLAVGMPIPSHAEGAQGMSVISYGAESYLLQATANTTALDSIEHPSGSFSAQGKQPHVFVELPYEAIAQADKTSLWDDFSLDVQLSLRGFDQIFLQNHENTRVLINGQDQSRQVSFGEDGLSFKMAGLTPQNASYQFDLRLEYETTTAGARVLHQEQVNLLVSYVNTQKNTYTLQLLESTTAGVALRDGIYYIDSPSGQAADVEQITINVRDQAGARLSERAYFSATLGEYSAPLLANRLNEKNSCITIDVSHAKNNPDQPHIYFTSLETRYALYRGKAIVKFRTAVQNNDPRGIAFTSDVYTIAAGQSIAPGFTTEAPVFHEIAPILSVASPEDNHVIDVTDGRVIGMAEGTAYIHLSHTHHYANGSSIVYTDTAKVIVQGQFTGMQGHTVTASKLFVRAAPSENAEKIGRYKRGDIAQVLEMENGWAKVQYSPGVTGYVSAQYLESSPTSTPTPAEFIPTEMQVDARNLNVRSLPSADDALLGRIPRGERITVLQTLQGGQWGRILYEGQDGYVSMAYLR